MLNVKPTRKGGLRAFKVVRRSGRSFTVVLTLRVRSPRSGVSFRHREDKHRSSSGPHAEREDYDRNTVVLTLRVRSPRSGASFWRAARKRSHFVRRRGAADYFHAADHFTPSSA